MSYESQFRCVVLKRMCFTKRTDVRIQQVDGETLVLDDQNGFIHQLNQTASFVWHQCDGQSSTTEIVRRVADEFDVDHEVAARDVNDIIKKLQDLKLLCE